jgi:hypothetical protein
MMSRAIWKESLCSRRGRVVKCWISDPIGGASITIFEETEKMKEITSNGQSSWKTVTRYVFSHPGEEEKKAGIECVSDSEEDAKKRAEKLAILMTVH